MRIEELKSPPGARKKRKRVGRGPGSGRGKTSGRGSKGSLSRSGKRTWTGFEGGQMPLIRRLPKRGFVSRKKKRFQIVNTGQLNRFEADALITREELLKKGLIKKKSVPVKLLGKGKLKKGLRIALAAVSRGALKKIKEAEGEVRAVKDAKGVH